jgi:4-amino-4-deoxy-L-arabinose transferase-like glycosyltransferase
VSARATATTALCIAALAALLFLPFLGHVPLFDWDEINFAESAREMLVTGDSFRVQIDYRPFWEKPPLFFWMQAASMRAFGVGEFAARFPNAMCGVLTLVLLFEIGRRLRGARFGRTWALVHAGSLLPFFYFKTAIIDPWFNLFMFGAVALAAVTAARYRRPKAVLAAAGAGLCVGLAVLTKGPVGLLLPGLTALTIWAFGRFRPMVSVASLVAAAVATLLVASLWYLPETLRHGPWFLREFLGYQVDLLSQPIAGHRGPIYYHLVVLLVGCFPASVLALRGLRLPSGDALAFSRWMIALLAVVLVVFSAVTTKIVHYSSLAYFPVSFLAAQHLTWLRETRRTLDRASTFALAVLALVVATAAAAVPWMGRHVDLVLPHVHDAFAAANLRAKVDWRGYEEWLGPVWLAAAIVSLLALRAGRVVAGTRLLLGSTMLLLLVVMADVVPKVHEHLQGAPVRFYRSLAGEDVTVEVLGFKSYAQLFYTRKLPPPNPDVDTLLHGEIQRPAYFVTRIDKASRYRALDELQELREENGYVFFVRRPR